MMLAENLYHADERWDVKEDPNTEKQLSHVQYYARTLEKELLSVVREVPLEAI